MEKALIIIGREESTESYLLLIGLNYIKESYNTKKVNPIQCLESLGLRFAKKISEREISLEVGILNGYALSEEGKWIKVEKITDTNIRMLEKILTNEIIRLSKGMAVATIPVAQIVN